MHALCEIGMTNQSDSQGRNLLCACAPRQERRCRPGRTRKPGLSRWQHCLRLRRAGGPSLWLSSISAPARRNVPECTYWQDWGFASRALLRGCVTANPAWRSNGPLTGDIQPIERSYQVKRLKRLPRGHRYSIIGRLSGERYCGASAVRAVFCATGPNYWVPSD